MKLSRFEVCSTREADTGRVTDQIQRSLHLRYKTVHWVTHISASWPDAVYWDYVKCKIQWSHLLPVYIVETNCIWNMKRYYYLNVNILSVQINYIPLLNIFVKFWQIIRNLFALIIYCYMRSDDVFISGYLIKNQIWNDIVLISHGSRQKRNISPGSR